MKKIFLMFILILFSTTSLFLASCQNSCKSCECCKNKDVKVLDLKTDQKTCPIMKDKKINKKYHTIYKGKVVYFCCPGCKEKFYSNPEKYMKKLKAAKLPDAPKDSK